MRNLSALVIAIVIALPSNARGAPPTDLSVKSFTVSVANTTVTYSAEICNISTKTSAAASTAGLYFNRSTAPSCTSAASITWQIPSLAQEQCHSVSHTRTNTPLGEYVAWVFADNTCAVKEALETNNVASDAYSVIPKLKISAFSATATGYTLSYAITARNDGIDVTTPISLALYFDRSTPPSCGDPPNEIWSIPTLLGEAEVTQSFSRTTVPKGSYRAWAYIDQGCAVEEDTEDDNADDDTYEVGPNLYLRQPRAQSSGTAVTYSVTVCNNGSLAVSGTNVALWYHRTSAPSCSTGSPDHTWTVPPLAPGSCMPLTHTRADAAAGSYTARFLADATCGVDESREDDNDAGVPHTVQGPDLYIQQLAAQINGKQVTLSADVCNSGTGPSTSFDVGFFFDATAAPDCQSSPDAVKTAPALDPAACATLTATLSDAGIGTKKAWVLADRGCVIAEDDETNNTATTDYTILPRPDLLLTELTADVDGNTVRFFATVCNADADMAAPASSTGLFFDRDAAPPTDCSDAADAAEPVVEIAPGACVNQAWTRAGVPLGQHTAHALADALCAIEEWDEANNLRAVSYEVSQVSPDGGTADSGTVPLDGGSPSDGGVSDAARADGAGDGSPRRAEGGCSCQLSERSTPTLLWLLAMLFCARRRPLRRRR